MIFYSKEDGGYIATVPGIEGLSAFGETEEEALKELLIAKEAYWEFFERLEEL